MLLLVLPDAPDQTASRGVVDDAELADLRDGAGVAHFASLPVVVPGRHGDDDVAVLHALGRIVDRDALELAEQHRVALPAGERLLLAVVRERHKHRAVLLVLGEDVAERHERDLLLHGRIAELAPEQARDVPDRVLVVAPGDGLRVAPDETLFALDGDQRTGLAL
mmetsp:Transcript_182270/g.443636  ORF Transcript_182270/g.443636 Transcript_182270/m.443636 type:complete len:165 (-) Transcript_182270:107-601(-)